MRGWLCPPWLGLVGYAALACSPPAVGARTPAPSVAAPATAPARPSKRPAAAPVGLQRTFTGQAQPSLVVENRFPIAQHVFIDWVEQAKLAPAASQRFELGPGTHTITCADSSDPDDHPAAISEAFESGYSYVYELRSGP